MKKKTPRDLVRAETVRLFKELRGSGIYTRVDLSLKDVYNAMCAAPKPRKFGRWLGYAYCTPRTDCLTARTNRKKITGAFVWFDGTPSTRQVIQETAIRLGMRVLSGGSKNCVKIKMLPTAPSPTDM